MPAVTLLDRAAGRHRTRDRRRHPADATRETLLRTTDVALFMAKRAGRDRVVAA